MSSLLPFSLLADLEGSLPRSGLFSDEEESMNRERERESRSNEAEETSWAVSALDTSGTGRHGGISNSTSSRNSHDADAESWSAPSLGGEPYDAVVSLPPGTFIEIYRERQMNRDESVDLDEGSAGAATIVSSAPSGRSAFETIQIRPSLSQDTHEAWPLSPHPQMSHEHAASITTTETVYRNENSLEGSHSDESSVDTFLLSLVPSTLLDTSSLEDYCTDISVASTCSSHHPHGHDCDRDLDAVAQNQLSQSRTVRHDRASFVHVANRLAVPQNHQRPTYWFSRFTEQDWLDFRGRADMVLNALEPPSEQRPLLTLPPPAPPAVDDVSHPASPRAHDPSEFLPESFLCSLCHDVIVGATTLGCACPSSTMCTACWETHQITCLQVENDGHGGSYVWVESPLATKTCPSCGGRVDSSLSCHALDVAILHAVQSLPPHGRSVQTAYYQRLRAWRTQVERRLAWRSQQRVARHDLLLAELIQQEEEHFWNSNRRANIHRRWNRGLVFLGEVVFCVAVAAVSSVGLDRIGRR